MPVTTSADPRQARSVLRASGLTRTFGSGKNLVTAVDHVGFNFHEGRSLPSWASLAAEKPR